jgi:Type I phosphodiesterase / nucleotide pyrophosphatase
VISSLLLVLALGAGAPASPSPSPAAGRAAPPRLAVIIAIDGLGWARLEQYRPWYVAGLKRLLEEGQVETACRYRHLNTETGPGHSSLSTGAPPRVTGIVANRWFEQDAFGAIRSVQAAFPSAPGTPGSAQATAIAGPGNLRVPTLGDQLRAEQPAARVVSVSGKDRAAILLAGRDQRHSVYWYNVDTGAFTTSSAYRPAAEARAVVDRFNEEARWPVRFGFHWTKLPIPEDTPAAPAAAWPVSGPDLFDFQIPVVGMGFPHDYRLNPGGYFAGLYSSPVIDELVADLAVRLLDDGALALGRGPAPDILALSFSAQDVVSHVYGTESEENLDVMRRLDVQLGRVLAAIEHASPGAVVALSADHGFATIPDAERVRNPAFRGSRLVYGPRTFPNMVDRLNRLIDSDLCLDARSAPVYASEGWNVIYNRPALPLHTVEGACGPSGADVDRHALDQSLARVVSRFFADEVEEVLPVAQAAAWPADDPATEFARNDLDLERSGDAFLVPRMFVQMSPDPGRGSGHGTHHEYDIHVPLVFWGGPFRALRSEKATTPYDLAPTLGSLLGVSLRDAVGESRKP